MNRRRTITAAVLAAAAVAVLTAAPAQAAGSVHLTRIYYNSPGSDTRTNASLDAEYVSIANTTGAAVQLKGWTLTDASGHKYTFSTFTLAKGKTVVVHTGHGTNTATNRYWGSGNYIWNNDHDRATLKRSTGAVQDTCAYNNARVAYVNC